MQSYEHHVVCESLQRRHPYLQEPFSSDIDPQQITTAVFDRLIPKFREVLIQAELKHENCRDALKTLNELVKLQENMDTMIDNDLLQITANLLKHPQYEVREQAAMLLSSFALSRRAREIFGYAFPMLQELLEDHVLKVREAVASIFEKLSVNDDGCQRIVSSKCAEAMIESFIAHSRDAGALQKHDGQYLIHLLEAFANLTFSDQGIEPLLGRFAVATFNKIISQQYVEDILSKPHYEKVRELCLRVLGNISINYQGKEECIQDKVILNAWRYLDSKHYQKRLNASLVLMSCTIHLEGKKQAVYYLDEQMEPKIVQIIIQRLHDMKEPELRKNLKVTLINIAELTDGFLSIAHELSDKTDLLEEVYGPRSVKALHNLLPKVTDLPDPLRIDPAAVKKYARYIKSLAYIMKTYKDEAAQVAVDQTINFAEKLAPFINPETGVQKETILCLREVCGIDQYNSHVLNTFLSKYGEVPIKRESGPGGMTTIKRELSQYADLLDLAYGSQILT